MLSKVAHPKARNVKTSKKKERYRTVYSAQQKKALEDAFNEHNFLKPERKKELMEETGLTNKQVLYWFQNRRAKYKSKLPVIFFYYRIIIYSFVLMFPTLSIFIIISNKY